MNLTINLLSIIFLLHSILVVNTLKDITNQTEIDAPHYAEFSCKKGPTRIGINAFEDRIVRLMIECEGQQRFIHSYRRDEFDVPESVAGKYIIGYSNGNGYLSDIWFSSFKLKRDLEGKSVAEMVETDRITKINILYSWERYKVNVALGPAKRTKHNTVIKTLWFTMDDGSVIKMPPNGPDI